MSFVEFAKSYGLIVDYVKADAKWHRVRTLDKPQHKNGAYLFDPIPKEMNDIKDLFLNIEPLVDFK